MKTAGFWSRKPRVHIVFITVLVTFGVTTSTVPFDVAHEAEGFPVSSSPDIMLTAGRKPDEVNIIDLNQDHLPDILTVNDDGNDISMFYQRSDRQFNATPDFSPYIGETPTSTAIGDINRDGLPDMIVVDTGCFPYALNCNMTVFYQRPDYSFSPVPDQVIGRTDIVPWKVVAGDYNSDGLLDAAMSGGLSGRIFVYLQLPGGGFPDAPDQILWTPDFQSFGLAGTDLNGDGLDDLALANHGSMTISLYYQRSDNSLPVYPDVNLTSGDGPTHVIPGDLNADGLTDLVVTNGQDHSFSIFYQGRNYLFPTSPDIKIGTGGTGNFVPFHAATGDLNSDGFTDIVVTRATKDLAQVYLQMAGGGFASSPSFTLDASGSLGAAVGDLNGDGLDDIAITIYQTPDVGPNVYLYYQETSGLPPITFLSVGDPRIDGPLPLVTRATPLSFQATDRSGTGIASTCYRINNGSWLTYAQGTTFNLSLEGISTIDFYSVDNGSNIEPTRTEMLGVDDTTPLTTISIGDPHLQSSTTWISPATNLSLSATDGPSPAAGINETSYRTWNASGWSPWLAYSTLFRLDSDGANAVQFGSTDLLGNAEAAQTVSMEVDGTPPFSFLAAPFVANGSRALTISAADAGVGVAHTHFSVDSGPWEYFAGVVYLSSDVDHQVNFYSDDLLTNIEPERSAFLPKATPGPLTSLQVGDPNYGIFPVFVTSSTPLTLNAQDRSGSGIRMTAYRLDGGSWTNYSSPFNLPSEGVHLLSYFSEDNTGVQGPVETSSLVVDDSPPESFLAVGSPSFAASGLFVTSTTPLSFSSVDSGAFQVGVDDGLCRLWDGGWTTWGSYPPSFTLSGPDGIRHVEYFASDLLGNNGAAQNTTLVLDDTPPATTILPAAGDFNITTPFTLTATDGWSGVRVTRYSIDGGVLTAYSGSFTLPEGSHNVSYYSIDNLDNTEQERWLVVTIQAPPPPNTPPAVTITSPIGGEEFAEGSTHTITWTMHDGEDVNANLTVYVNYTTGGSTISIVAGQKGADSFFWTLPDIEATGVIVNITVIDTGGLRGWDESGPFNIKALSTPMQPLGVEANLKPLVAAVFTTILMILGLWSSRKKPWKDGKGRIAVVRAFTTTSLPFVLAEAVTGLTSFATGEMRIPPAIGTGTVIDVTILVVGTVASIIRIMEATTVAE